MRISVTFRDIDSSDPLRNHAEEKLAKLDTFLTEAADIHVILEMEGNEHKAEMNVLEKNLKTSASATSDDMYKSINAAYDKLERQLRRHKERRTEHR